MSFTKVNPATWGVNDELTSAQINILDTDHANSLDKSVAGDTILGLVTVNGASAGLDIGPTGTGLRIKNFATGTVKTGGTLHTEFGSNISLDGQLNGSFLSQIATEGSFDIASGGTFNINAAATSNIDIGNASSIDFQSGSALNINTGCTTTATVGSGSSLALASGSTFSVNSGSTSTLGLGNGSTLTTTAGTTGKIVLGDGPADITINPTVSHITTFPLINVDGNNMDSTFGAYIQQTGAIGSFFIAIPVHNGAILSTMVVYFLPGTGHAALPAATDYPGIEVFRGNFPVGGTAAYQDLLSTTIAYCPAASSALDYDTGGVRAITLTADQNNTIDTNQYSYYLKVFGEKGANYAGSPKFLSAKVTYTSIANMNFP